MTEQVDDGMILGINPCIAGMNYHDPSVCLLDSNRIVFAIEEERLNRIRHSSGLFPTMAVDECKKIAERLNRTITDIAVGFDPALTQNRNLINPTLKNQYLDNRARMALLIRRASGLNNARVSFYPHHEAHAASAVNATDWNHAMCVVIDGTSEMSAASIWEADNDALKLIDSVDMPNSLGYFYAAATAYLGFHPWGEEGKLMALAPYGNFNEAITQTLSPFFDAEDGSYNLSSIIGPCLHDGFALNVEKVVGLFEQLFKHPRRENGSSISSWHKDFAFCVQDCVENAVLMYIKKWRERLNPTKICCAGGLFMNCKMNGFLRSRLAPIDIFIQPVAGDAGTAIGAAVLRAQEKTNERVHVKLEELSLGISYSEKDIEEILQKSGVHYYRSSDVSAECAQFVNDGNIVAWFQGKNELGCRALGHRSILAAPTPHVMSDVINQRVKHREEWRPFACSLLAEFASEVLVDYNPVIRPAFMIEAFAVSPQWYSCMEAVMHIADKTTRPQVVCKEGSNQLYHEMIRHYYNISGCPMVLNTSLNDKGQPIIQTPDEAIAFFVSHDVDYLIIENFIVTKNGIV